ncbi:uncharacterized protein LOC115223464 [Octopus sinensis]|uniref:Uncharacterized protein LOC115223464 n=1 Tax=Octopus sinensis TaxID=2607531 RepID=A0A6P7TJL2_9MOLL|nr:uncharacterized protein LOC115223464 [Octopus sinensis]
MGYKFNVKSGDAGVEEYLEVPGESYPKRKFNRRIFALFGIMTLLCTAIGVGVGIHVTGKTHKNVEALNQTRPTTTTTKIPTTTTPLKASDRHPLLLIAIGHFRANYLDRNVTKTLKMLAQEGVHATYMQSVYPTLSSPNLYSIVTGLYPESHGITNNVMVDSKIKSKFDANNVSSTLDPRWWQGEPIWVKVGHKKAISFGWPGAKVNISGVIPEKFPDREKSLPTKLAMWYIVQQLKFPPVVQPHLITWYIDDLVKVSETYGPDSPLVDDAIKDIDDTLQVLVDQLRSLMLLTSVNIIIVSDHGIMKTSPELTIQLPSNNLDIEWQINGRTSAMIALAEGNSTSTSGRTEFIKNLECSHSNLKIFTKDSIPKLSHFFNNPRSGDVYITTRNQWMIKNKNDFSLGSSGFDVREENMKAIFIAIGPDFKERLEIEPFENVELYNMMCALLNVPPNDNNGTNGRLEDALNMDLKKQKSTIFLIEKCVRSNNISTIMPVSSRCSNSSEIEKLIKERLKKAEDDKESLIRKHLPFLVLSSTKDMSSCILPQRDYIVAVDTNTSMPLWAAFTLNIQSKWKNEEDNNVQLNKKCLFLDTRLNKSLWGHTVAKMKNTGHLFNLDFLNATEGMLSSNTVPMMEGFKNGIWKFLWSTIKQYAYQGDIAVVLGPIYDQNQDGHADNMTSFHDSSPPSPTHFFAILQRNQDQKSSTSLDIISFVLPHLPKVTNCMNFREYLLDNIVSLQDIEHLTNLRFDRSLNVKQRTFLSPYLWNVPNSQPWLKQECSQEKACERTPILLLLSLHNFNADNLNLVKMPALEKLKRCGVQASYMRPVYPYKSLPNLYSIVTGLYPESHGIIDEEMYDPGQNKSFTSTSSEPFWWGGEPIWNTAENQNKTSSVYFWPGFKDKKTGKRVYESPIDYIKGVNMILNDLSLPPEKQPNVIAAYLKTPNPDLHIEDQLNLINDAINQLMNGIKERHLENCINLVIVSDHGTKENSCGRLVNLSDFVNVTSLVFDGEASRIDTRFKKTGKDVVPQLDSVKSSENLNISTKINCGNRHVSLYNPSTLPRHFHYTHNQRIGDFILVTDAGWIVAQSSETECKKLNYDLDNSKQAFFLASGPSFVNSTLTEPFDNIELYNMMADLLKIEPAPNNGTEGALNAILLKNASLPQETPKQANYTLCQWSNVTKTNICPQLLSNEPQIYVDTFNEHLPFGLPYLEEHSGKNCLQFSKSFVFAFDSELQMPKWVSSTMKKVRSTTKPPHPLSQSDISSTNCFKYNSNTSNISTGYLLPYVDDEHYMKTAVPMFEGFKNGIWKEIHNLINEYRTKYSLINAVAGPIFENITVGEDVDDATVATTRQISEENRTTFSVPSHFYLILGKCQSDGDFQDCRNHTEIMSVILPHTQETASCKRPRKYIEEYRSRIRDVEILTGTEFLTNLSKSDSVRLRTFLPSKLWEGKRASSWMNRPFCEKIDTSQCKNMSNGPTLIFISLDGFRVSYLNRHVTPVISRLRECGVHSPYMKPAFPSKTFPNHFSMATGLYPETHGIIANRMFDIKYNDSFKTGNIDSKWWNAEPIWKRFSDNGIKTAALYPGSTVLKYHPDNYEKYTPVKSFEDNMDKAVAWIKNGVRFVALYFEQPDESGHRRGPNSAKVVKALQTIDSIIGVLMDELYEERLENCIDIVIVADHGMTDISLERVVELSDFLNEAALKQVMSIGALVRISAKYKKENNGTEMFTNETKDKVSEEELLSDLKCQSPHMNVYAKRHLPKVLHYANNIRIEDVVILPEDKWSVVKDIALYTDKGSHGYDNRYRSMRSLFLAYGPDFKQNLTIKPFENIELYNLFTDIFNVTGAPNNGTVGRLDSILHSPPIRNKQSLMGQYLKTPFNMSLVKLKQFLQDNDCPNSPVFSKMVKGLFVLLNDSNNHTDFEGAKSFGLPASNTTVLLLPHTSHVTVYDSGIKLPTFIATTLTKENKLKQKSSKEVSCFIPDPRLTGQSKYLPNCSQEASTKDNLTWMNLYPSDFITDDKKIILNLSSSCIPVPYKFVSELWDEALNKISEWLNTYSEINMFSGPIFDYDLDGRADDQETIWKFSPETVPTHVFLVLTSYNHTKSDLENSVAYILPTDLGDHSYCRTPSWILQNHKARIRDVELLTNLEFFPEMTSEKAVISRTSL